MRKYSADKQFWKRQRPDGSFSDVWQTRIGGKRVSTDTTDLAAARKWKARRESERADPRRARAEATTIEDCIRDLYAELKRRGRSAATQERAREKLAHFPRLWGLGCKMSEVDAEKVDRYVDTRLDDGVTRLTIRDERAFLRQVCKLAKRYGKWPYAVEDVFPLFETGSGPKKDFVAPGDLDKLLDRLVGRHAAHALFFVITAGRLADAERARPEDFDLVNWKVTVRGSKTEKSYRTIPILEHLQPLAARMMQLVQPSDDYLPWSAVVAPDGKLFLPWSNIHRDLELACERAGIPKVTTNGLRRTFGKLARLNGYSLDTISKLFGHTTAKLVRDVYADVEGEELDAIIARERAAARTQSAHAVPKLETKPDESGN